jgi:hypothetical protein
MSKFRVNERVVSAEDGKIGVIKAREVTNEGKNTTVKYMVSFGGGMESWKILTKNQINKIPKQNKSVYYTKVVKLSDGKILTFVARTFKFKYSNEVSVPTESIYEDEWEDAEESVTMNVVKGGKILVIGFSIWNGTDEYDEKIGYKYAKARCVKKPYVSMMSSFGGEFNQLTIDKIIEAKAEYIEEHIDEIKFK